MSHNIIGMPIARQRTSSGRRRFIYMAGSMGTAEGDGADWRQGWRPETLPDVSAWDAAPDTPVVIGEWGFIYTGPYGSTLSNHSFVHGLDSAQWSYEADIFERSLLGIERADAVMARIDVKEIVDCYGTLTEIGYAYGKGKPVYLLLVTTKDRGWGSDVWFAESMSKHVARVPPSRVMVGVEALTRKLVGDLAHVW